MRLNTVFVVDDDELMREVLVRFLDREGFRVQSFSSPRELFGRASKEVPGVIISDVQMPGMNGIELVRLLRQAGCGSPIVLVTGDPTPEVRRQAAELGVSHVVEKSQGQLPRLAAIVRELSGRGGGETAVAEADRIGSTFLSALSHEIRTPLTALQLAVDELFASAAESGRDDMLLGIARRNVLRLVRFIDEHLELLHMSLASTAVRTRTVELGRVIEAAAGETRLEWQSGPNGPAGGTRSLLVATDRERLEAVVRHVVGMLSRGGEGPVVVALEVREPARAVRLSLASGGAVSPDSVDSGWEDAVGGIKDLPAFAVDACRKIVRGLGGELAVPAEEGPPTVTLTLPLSFGAEHEGTRHAAAASKGPLAPQTV